MQRVTTVLFDLGNTLFHLDHGFIAATISAQGHPVAAAEVAAAEYRGKAAIDAEIRARRLGTDAARQRPYFDTILDVLDVPAAVRPAVAVALRDENSRDSLWRVIHDDTPAVLSALRARGYTLGIVSNADGRVAAGLRAAGLFDHFTAVIDSHVVGVEKPDRRIFELALAACRAEPTAALFVGDIYEIDVQGGRNAGIESLLLDPLGLYPPVDCERIDSLARLLERL